MLKMQNCGELRVSDVGKTVTLAGWLHRRRDHGGLIFMDLRDRSGLVQVTVDPTVGEAYAVAEQARNEYVLQVIGTVRPRPEGTLNANLATGEIEVLAQSITNPQPGQDATVSCLTTTATKPTKRTRLKYRYLDLRRARMQKNIILRHKTIKFIRDYLDQQGFLEIETPMMIKSTPEGARDYVVPSRVQHGKFYALPQSPQQLKQLLMVAGYENYFQIARCMRDEDLRGDRQPEFTQLDLEMSFVERDDVLAVVEGLDHGLVPRGDSAQAASSALSRNSAIQRSRSSRYGTRQARPALRHGAARSVSDALGDSEFKVFAETVRSGGVVKVHHGAGVRGTIRAKTWTS